MSRWERFTRLLARFFSNRPLCTHPAGCLDIADQELTIHVDSKDEKFAFCNEHAYEWAAYFLVARPIAVIGLRPL